MLQIQSLVSTTKLDPDDMVAVLSKLDGGGWKPAILSSQREFFKLAGISEPDRNDLRVRTEFDTRSLNAIFGADVFFRGPDVYYVITSPSGVSFRAYSSRSRYIRGLESGQPEIEAGLISPERDNILDRLGEFTKALEDASMATLDGRKARHMAFSWAPRASESGRLASLIAPSEESGMTYARAELVDPDVAGARALENRTARTLLIELSQANFVRGRDISARKDKTQEGSQAALKDLQQSGLIKTEYLLECKKASTPLTRLPSMDTIRKPEIAGLICHSCGAQFKDENLSEGYSLSELGRKLSRQSYWMTLWITKHLTDCGVPLDSIIWNVSEAGQEVDLLVEYLGQLWIMELKDREFGAGDAYALNYRRVRYQADKVIIVTTEKVSKDARKVFDEMLPKRGRDPGALIYIEGLESFDDAIQTEISATELLNCHRTLEIIGQLSGYDLTEVLAKRTGCSIERRWDSDDLQPRYAIHKAR